MSESGSALIDWREQWLREHNGEHVSLLVPIGGSVGEEPEAEGELYAEIQAEVRELSGSATAAAEYIDPYVGAGGYGVGVIWEFVAQGADLLAWIGAALAAAPRIRRVARHLAAKFGAEGEPAPVYLSAEAVRVLAVAEVCETHNVPPQAINAVQVLEHTYPPVEPTVEKQQLYSAYTIAVGGYGEDRFYHVWTFVVTCQGHVIAATDTKVPIPNATHWHQVELPARKLKGL